MISYVYLLVRKLISWKIKPPTKYLPQRKDRHSGKFVSHFAYLFIFFIVTCVIALDTSGRLNDYVISP